MYKNFHLRIDLLGLNQYYHAFTRTTDSLIAQPVEQRTVNPCVPGSSPGQGAKYLKPCICKAFSFSASVSRTS
jgi:hypothetical protein